MKNPAALLLTTLAVAVVAIAWADAAAPPANESTERSSLVGAWRSQIRFTSGEWAQVKDLEFMYVYNVGGTMTESSNYDAAPPVPPAYGVWRKTGSGQFETRYAFYATKSPGTFQEIAKGGGWLPAGHGVLTEKITVSDDGKSYRSALTYAAFDTNGRPIEGGGAGTGTGTRMGF